MKKVMLLFVILTIITSSYSHAQCIDNPPILRIGDLATNEVTYEKILGYPKIVYAQNGCVVAGYNLTILPRGEEELAYVVKGDGLTPAIKTALQELKGISAKIYVDSILVNCNGKTTEVNDWLAYYCVPTGHIYYR